MDGVQLKLVGDQIEITLRRDVDHAAKVRRISGQDAFAMGLLLTSDAPDHVVNFEANDGVILQIENRPYCRAWLSIDGRHGGHSLVACLEGKRLRAIGRCLHQFYIAATKAQPRRRKSQTFLVSHCYIDE